MNTAIFLLRCVQLGLNMSDLEELTVGTIYDMITEQGNDSCEYAYKARQEDFDKF